MWNEEIQGSVENVSPRRWIIREVKHDVYGKRQTSLSSALSTVESKYLYLLWIVRDTFLFLCDLFKDYKKRIENQK